MYVGTQFNWYDYSDIPDVPEEMAALTPLFLCTFSSDKGPEDMREVKGQDFYKLYGTNISFVKHGQPLIQAANVIRAGGRLLAKRVVASDSTLANTIIVAKVKNVSVQRKDAQGNLLYIDPVSGKETTTVSDKKSMDTTVSIKYEAEVVQNCLETDTVETVANTYLDNAGTTDPTDNSTVYSYPLFTVADNGRGVSSKKFKITPDYNTSKKLDYMVYTFTDLDNTSIMESQQFTADPEISDGDKNLSLSSVSKASLIHVAARSIDEGIESYITRVSTLLNMTPDDFRALDILFAKDRKGVSLDKISIDATGLDLNYIYGLELTEGANGKFGDTPFGTQEYIDQTVNFYSGKFSDDIYDLDNYKIDLVMDCNYPAEVKREIENLVSYRGDAFYFRDLGLNIRSIDQAIAADADSTKNRFCASYATTYDIIEPFSKKQVNVTMMYSLAAKLVNHFLNGRQMPPAGQLYDMIMTDAIDKTVNIIPKVTPAVNQKTILDDARINYATYQDGKLVIETLYTSQPKYTQFSFINNVLAAQEVVKAVRTECPKTRYSFLEGKDLDNYKDDVDRTIKPFVTNFKELDFVYTQDPVMEANKIFHASLKFTFKNFVQSEIFDIYALG